MNMQQMIADLKADEGMSAFPYNDNLGYATIGIGRCIDPRKGAGLSPDEQEFLAMNDITRVYRDLMEKLPWFTKLDDSRQRALVNMGFQLGVNGVLAFKNMLNALKAGDYDKAMAEALNSKWAKQTPNRAARVALLLKFG